MEKAWVEGEGGIEIGDVGEEFVDGLALGGVVRDGIEMLDAPPAAGEGFGGVLKGEEARCVGGLFRSLVGDGIDGFLRLGEGLADGGFDGIRGEGGPAGLEVGAEECVHNFQKSNFNYQGRGGSKGAC